MKNNIKVTIFRAEYSYKSVESGDLVLYLNEVISCYKSIPEIQLIIEDGCFNFYMCINKDNKNAKKRLKNGIDSRYIDDRKRKKVYKYGDKEISDNDDNSCISSNSQEQDSSDIDIDAVICKSRSKIKYKISDRKPKNYGIDDRKQKKVSKYIDINEDVHDSDSSSSLDYGNIDISNIFESLRYNNNRIYSEIEDEKDIQKQSKHKHRHEHNYIKLKDRIPGHRYVGFSSEDISG